MVCGAVLCLRGEVAGSCGQVSVRLSRVATRKESVSSFPMFVFREKIQHPRLLSQVSFRPSFTSLVRLSVCQQEFQCVSSYSRVELGRVCARSPPIRLFVRSPPSLAGVSLSHNFHIFTPCLRVPLLPLPHLTLARRF